MGKLIAYKWISYLDIDEKRYSDWDSAEYCDMCRRKIVHVYTIQPNSDSLSTLVVGRECAAKALGWPRNNPTKLDKLVHAALLKEKQAAEEKKNLLNRLENESMLSLYDAVRDCRLRNPFNGFPYVGEVVILTKNDKFYALPDNCNKFINLAKENNWYEVKPFEHNV